MKGKYMLDVHTHTIVSGHAYSTIDENVAFGVKKGLSLVGISDHAPKMPGAAHPLYFLNLKVVPCELHGIKLMKGIELNILDYSGRVDLKNNLLKKLDYAIASLHTPCIEPGDMEENTAAVVGAIKNPYINIIGHPCDPRYPLDIKQVVRAAVENNVLLEINNASLNPSNGRCGGDRELLELIRECKRQALPVILGSDAHFYTDVGRFDNVLPLIDEAEMPDELIINTDIEKFKGFIELKQR